MKVATGDNDNDDYPDRYVTNFGRNVLYTIGTTERLRTPRRKPAWKTPWSISAAFLDYVGRAALDLFVLNYLDFTMKGNKKCDVASGELDYCTPKMYPPVPDNFGLRLLRTDGPVRRERRNGQSFVIEPWNGRIDETVVAGEVALQHASLATIWG